MITMSEESLRVLIAVICAIPILLTQAIWIFRDAGKRGENRWLWGLLGLISCPGSLIVYLLVTRPGKSRCKNCGRNVEKSYKTCPYCGIELYKPCPNCGRDIEEKWEFCPYCSYNLKEE